MHKKRTLSGSKCNRSYFLNSFPYFQIMIDETQTRTIMATDSHKIATLANFVTIMQVRAIAIKTMLIINVAIKVFLETSIISLPIWFDTNIIT